MILKIFLLIFVSILPLCYGQKIQFFKVKAKSVNFAEKLGINSDNSIHSLSSFRISKQITRKQYYQYLRSIEKDSSYAFYLSQLPNITNQENLTKNYLNSAKLDNEPVIGISMDNACNFAIWYSAIQGNEKVKYRLPAVFEWISMNEEHIDRKKDGSSYNSNRENKFDGPLLDWTINAFDESAYEFYDRGQFPIGYFYQHKKYDPKVKKRKCVIGKSFRIALADPIRISTLFSYYADEGYADVGFRLIEVSRKDPFEKFTRQEVQSDIDLRSLSYMKTTNYSVEQRKQHSIDLDGQIVEYSTINGILDGAFSVYKKINNLKILFVKGEMKNNCRIGNWTIYDLNNPTKILIKRIYRSHLEFKQLTPNYSSNELISFVEDEINPPLGLDQYGCKEYASVTSANFIFSSRLYRELLFEKNKFPANSIVESLKYAIEKKELITYDTSNFTLISQNNPFEKFNGNIIGFRIKEDFFFDKNRKLSETRIIGLSPIYFDSVLNVKKELCWLYFPQLRKVLVELIDPYSGLNLDELFFERFFFGEVYKTVNRYEKMDDEEKINKLQYKDIELLLTEHQIWLFLEGLIEKY
jgi:hypothetical protein